MLILDLVKYLLLFTHALGAVLSAGTIIAGFIISFLLKKILPEVIFTILGLSFLTDLPQYLHVAGSMVLVVTFLGTIGAFFDGSAGKWLLAMHAIAFTVLVTLEIFTLVTLYLSHRGHISPTASPLIADFRPQSPHALDDTMRSHLYDKEDTNSTEVQNTSIQAHPDSILSTTLLRNRRSLNMGAIKAKFGDAVKAVKDSAESIKETVENKVELVKDGLHLDLHKSSALVPSDTGAINFDPNIYSNSSRQQRSPGNPLTYIKDKAASIAHGAASTARGGVNAVRGGVNAVRGGIDLATNLVSALGDAAKFLIGIFKPLTPEEEKRVKIIRPLLGRLTGPAFNLTRSYYIMIICEIAIVIEIIYILLGIYLFTKK